jgi:hypothetical protein
MVCKYSKVTLQKQAAGLKHFIVSAVEQFDFSGLIKILPKPGIVLNIG